MRLRDAGDLLVSLHPVERDVLLLSDKVKPLRYSVALENQAVVSVCELLPKQHKPDIFKAKAKSKNVQRFIYFFP